MSMSGGGLGSHARCGSEKLPWFMTKHISCGRRAMADSLGFMLYGQERRTLAPRFMNDIVIGFNDGVQTYPSRCPYYCGNTTGSPFLRPKLDWPSVLVVCHLVISVYLRAGRIYSKRFPRQARFEFSHIAGAKA